MKYVLFQSTWRDMGATCESTRFPAPSEVSFEISCSLYHKKFILILLLIKFCTAFVGSKRLQTGLCWFHGEKMYAAKVDLNWKISGPTEINVMLRFCQTECSHHKFSISCWFHSSAAADATAKRQSHHSPSLFQTPQCKRRIQYVISLSSLMVLPTLNAHATRPKIL